MFKLNVCSAINNQGKECMAPVYEDAPLRMCLKHLRVAGWFWENNRAVIVGAALSQGQSDDIFCRRDVGRVETKTSVVYYIIHGNRIKIGTSMQWKNRVRGLPHDRVLALELGNETQEHIRHKQFDHLRIAHSEWFHEADDLWDHIIKTAEDNPELTEAVDRYNHNRANRSNRGGWY